MKYIALLRGINVGGHNIIPMATLKEIFESAKFKNVSTYIQSGNVLFDSTVRDRETVHKKIDRLLLSSLGYKVTVFIQTVQDLKNIVEKNPFHSSYKEGKTKLYVVFLEQQPSNTQQQLLLAQQVQGMEFSFGTRVVYCLLDAKFKGNDSPFSNARVEKVLGQQATTRNWTTVHQLLKLGVEQ